MEEQQEFQIKETNNTITQKTDMAYEIWILDYPKKKEKDVVEEEVFKVHKLKKSGQVDSISIEEQKIILLAPTLIEFDHTNNLHKKLLLTTRNHLSNVLSKKVMKILDTANSFQFSDHN